jgi:hypothetical protein
MATITDSTVSDTFLLRGVARRKCQWALHKVTEYWTPPLHPYGGTRRRR